MSWWDKLLPPKIKKRGGDGSSVPEGLWGKCSSCLVTLYTADLIKNLQVCPKCNYHGFMSARERIDVFLDKDSFQETQTKVTSIDFLKFKDTRKYSDRLYAAKKATDEEDAIITGRGTLKGLPVVIAVFEFKFIGGSMGSVVGEKFTRAVQDATENNQPFICFSTSGGARMQEGLTSLLQMSKTSAALHFLSGKSIPFVSVLTNPTMGGVSASFAFLGDIVIAEPGALIGFAGPRVIEQTVRETLPEGFQRSEFLMIKGALDQIVDRRYIKDTIFSLVSMLLNRHTVRTTEITNMNSQSSLEL